MSLEKIGNGTQSSPTTTMNDNVEREKGKVFLDRIQTTLSEYSQVFKEPILALIPSISPRKAKAKPKP